MNYVETSMKKLSPERRDEMMTEMEIYGLTHMTLYSILKELNAGHKRDMFSDFRINRTLDYFFAKYYIKCDICGETKFKDEFLKSINNRCKQCSKDETRKSHIRQWARRRGGCNI